MNKIFAIIFLLLFYALPACAKEATKQESISACFGHLKAENLSHDDEMKFYSCIEKPVRQAYECKNVADTVNYFNAYRLVSPASVNEGLSEDLERFALSKPECFAMAFAKAKDVSALSYSLLVPITEGREQLLPVLKKALAARIAGKKNFEDDGLYKQASCKDDAGKYLAGDDTENGLSGFISNSPECFKEAFVQLSDVTYVLYWLKDELAEESSQLVRTIQDALLLRANRLAD